MDSNHRSITQQIYSLSPLATRESSLIQLSALDFRVLDYYSKGIWKMQAFFWIFFDFFWKILKWMWLRTFLKNPRLPRCGKCAFSSRFFQMLLKNHKSERRLAIYYSIRYNKKVVWRVLHNEFGNIGCRLRLPGILSRGRGEAVRRLYYSEQLEKSTVAKTPKQNRFCLSL